MNIERLSYRGLPTCYRLSNGVIDAIITGDLGTRIIRFGFVGERNEFFESDPLEVPANKSVWQLYGGHRLWHAPEQAGRTDLPDNQPITVEDHGEFVRVIQPLEDATGIAKSMDITLGADSASLRIVHRLRNQGVWDVRLAVWALSVMNSGGMAIIPLPPRASHDEVLLPTSSLALWAYTDLSDPRWRFGAKYLYLKQDRNFAIPQKIGALVPNGWAAYFNDHHLFVKQFSAPPPIPHVDFGSNVEVFTNDFMLEVETLSPLVTLPPGGSAEHVEHWTLARDIPTISSDEDVDQFVLPLTQPRSQS
ncbi:MAG: hypothetical protein IAE80_28925 [Anaerolinea sp.]|nr:hypothetical protein [Anaerolinea sp.]